ncbi:hypothetical protein GKODMF_14150 [Candidatus Electrothrix gigas]
MTAQKNNRLGGQRQKRDFWLFSFIMIMRKVRWVVGALTLIQSPVVVSLLVLSFCAFQPKLIHAAAISGYWEYFIPGDEKQVRDVLADLDSDSPSDKGISIIGIAAWTDDTTIYYDHWENGYSFDPDNPDKNDADEIVVMRETGTIATACSEDNDGTYTPDCQTADSYHVFDSHDIPRNGWSAGSGCTGAETTTGTANYCYDGRDRIFIAGGNVTLSRATWTTKEGSLQALAWEVYPIRPQLTTYILPFGEDLNSQGLLDFERVFGMFQATKDNTAFQVDFNNDGTFDPIDVNRDGDCNDPGEGTSVTLNAGETILISRDSDGNSGAGCTSEAALGTGGSLNTGTKIIGSDTLQAHYIVGDEGSTYEIRGLSAFPRGLWAKEYYAPVGSHTDSTDVFLHNPHSTSLDVNYETEGGNGIITIPANSSISFEAETGSFLPNTSGAYFSAADEFWGVSTIDTEGVIFDWGYALVPASMLRNENRLSWAPAYTPGVGSCDTTGETDQSGLFITPAQANTTLYVDDNGDGVADQTFNLSLLDSLYIEDSTFGVPKDRDLSNARVWATGPYSAAWGQNPSKSGSGDNCALDMGYTILPSVNMGEMVVGIDKTADPAVLGLAAGGVSEFTLKVSSGEFYGLDSARVTDTLPANVSYVNDSTTITFADGTSMSGAAVNPVISGQKLTWILNNYKAGGGDLAENSVVTVSFSARNNIGRSEGDIIINDSEICGIRIFEEGTSNEVTQDFCATDFAHVLFSDFELAITKTTGATDPVTPGDTIPYTVTVTNPGTQPITDVAVFDPLPDGVQYVAASGTATCNGVNTTFHNPPNIIRTSNNCTLNQGENLILTF